MNDEYATEVFADAAYWRKWLTEHHEIYDGVWLRIYKKSSGVTSVTYAEALDEALCFGWIDGLKKATMSSRIFRSSRLAARVALGRSVILSTLSV